SALATGNVITAKVSMESYYSAASNSVTVVASPTAITPTVTGSYTEGGTSVSGTLPSATPAGIVTLYEDGAAIGTVSTALNATTWSVTGLGSTLTMSLDNHLYAGSQLTATFTPTGGTEGSVSNTVIVQCIMALTNKTVTATKYKFCSSEIPSVTIAASESGVIYTMVKHGTFNVIGASLVGTGSTITLTGDSTFAQIKANAANKIKSVNNESFTVDITAEKISPVSCTSTETDTAYLREDCDAVYTANSYSAGHIFNNGD